MVKVLVVLLLVFATACGDDEERSCADLQTDFDAAYAAYQQSGDAPSGELLGLEADLVDQGCPGFEHG